MKRIFVLVLSIFFILSTVFVIDGSKAEAVSEEEVIPVPYAAHVTVWIVPGILLIAVIIAVRKGKKINAELDTEKKALNDLANVNRDMPRTNLCSHCGVQNDDDDLFCVSCGKKLTK